MPLTMRMTYVGLSAFTFSVMSVFVKIAGSSIPALQVAFWRSFIAWVINLGVMSYERVEYPFGDKDSYKLLFLRGSLATVSMTMGFYAVTVMSWCC